jgi:lipopolysaccharide transport system ATP-binding protein
VGTGFRPKLTGCENIYLNRAILRMKKAEVDSKFDAIVAIAGREKFIDISMRHFYGYMSP